MGVYACVGLRWILMLRNHLNFVQAGSLSQTQSSSPCQSVSSKDSSPPGNYRQVVAGYLKVEPSFEPAKPFQSLPGLPCMFYNVPTQFVELVGD